MDGRHWCWNAKALQWDRVAVEIIPDDEVLATIFDTLVHRRHYTKGQLAFIIAPSLDEIFSESQKRRAAGVSANLLHSVQKVATVAQTPEEIAGDLGISYRVLMQARQIHEKFSHYQQKRTLTDRDGAAEKGVTFREFFEPRILRAEDPEAPQTRAYGLGAVLAGIKQVETIESRRAAGETHGGGRPENVEQQLVLFKTAFKDLKNRFDYWTKWQPDVKEEAAKSLPITFEKMPDDLLLECERVIKAEKKRRNN